MTIKRNWEGGKKRIQNFYYRYFALSLPPPYIDLFKVICFTDWPLARLTDQQIGLLGAFPIKKQAECMPSPPSNCTVCYNWLTDYLGSLTVCRVYYLASWLTNLLSGLLTQWHSDWVSWRVSEWVSKCVMYWLSDCLCAGLTFWLGNLVLSTELIT